MKIKMMFKTALLSTFLITVSSFLINDASAISINDATKSTKIQFTENTPLNKFNTLNVYTNKYIVLGGNGTTIISKYRNITDGVLTKQLKTEYLGRYQEKGYMVRNVIKGKNEVYFRLQDMITGEVFFADINLGQLKALTSGTVGDTKAFALYRYLTTTASSSTLILQQNVTTYKTTATNKKQNAKFTKDTLVLQKGTSVIFTEIFTDINGAVMVEGYVLGKTVYFPFTNAILNVMNKTMNYSAFDNYATPQIDKLSLLKENPQGHFLLDNQITLDVDKDIKLKANRIYEYKTLGNFVVVRNLEGANEVYTVDIDTFAKRALYNHSGTRHYLNTYRKYYQNISVLKMYIQNSKTTTLKFKANKTYLASDGKTKYTVNKNGTTNFANNRIQVSYLDEVTYYIVNISGNLYRINANDVTVSYNK